MLRKLHKSLTAKSNQDIVLIANAMFSQRGFPMKDSFVAANKANFQCESRVLDFANNQGAAEEINEWVNNKTKGRRCEQQLFKFVYLLLNFGQNVAFFFFSPGYDAALLLPHVVCWTEYSFFFWLNNDPCVYIFIQVTSPPWSNQTCWTRL